MPRDIIRHRQALRIGARAELDAELGFLLQQTLHEPFSSNVGDIRFVRLAGGKWQPMQTHSRLLPSWPCRIQPLGEAEDAKRRECGEATVEDYDDESGASDNPKFENIDEDAGYDSGYGTEERDVIDEGGREFRRSCSRTVPETGGGCEVTASWGEISIIFHMIASNASSTNPSVFNCLVFD
ncbi:hypothetical protein BDZ45DRAFT_746334 [Acephala macrosclerotiorum]|nr:hypothetical protein BDZ45DRAFT_746334 [Acephala macrosclerotiorum]